MIDIFKVLFTNPMEQSPTELVLVETQIYDENPNFLIDRERIQKILTEIEASSPFCTIQLEGVKDAYTSSLIKLQLDKKLIILDELLPKDGNIKLQRQKALKFSAYHKGIYLSFFCDDVEVGISNGINYYKCAIPNRIYYPQRRTAPRLEVARLGVNFCGIMQKSGISVSGYVFDLSRGGAGINLPANKGKLQRSDKLKNCQIMLDDYTMDFEFDVRFVKPIVPGVPKMQLGGLFDKLTPKSQAKLSHYLSALERTEIRRLKA